MRAQHRHKRQSGSVALAVKRDFKKGKKTALCVESRDTLLKTEGGRRQHNTESGLRRVTYTGQPRDKEMEANMSQWRWVQHWLHQTRKTGQLLPSG